MFNWLAEIEGEGRKRTIPTRSEPGAAALNWLFKGLCGRGVLTLDREWFLLKGGLERVLYRVARKHAGDQPQGWTCRFDVLYKKTGSEEPTRNFAVRLRRLIARNDLPRYAMTLTKTVDGSQAVHFIARRFLEQRTLPATPKKIAAEPPRRLARWRPQPARLRQGLRRVDRGRRRRAIHRDLWRAAIAKP